MFLQAIEIILLSACGEEGRNGCGLPLVSGKESTSVHTCPYDVHATSAIVRGTITADSLSHRAGTQRRRKKHKKKRGRLQKRLVCLLSSAGNDSRPRAITKAGIAFLPLPQPNRVTDAQVSHNNICTASSLTNLGI